jgi:hypothetical protein
MSVHRSCGQLDPKKRGVGIRTRIRGTREPSRAGCAVIVARSSFAAPWRRWTRRDATQLGKCTLHADGACGYMRVVIGERCRQRCFRVWQATCHRADGHASGLPRRGCPYRCNCRESGPAELGSKAAGRVTEPLSEVIREVAGQRRIHEHERVGDRCSKLRDNHTERLQPPCAVRFIGAPFGRIEALQRAP